jgi:hypothetical protein
VPSGKDDRRFLAGLVLIAALRAGLWWYTSPLLHGDEAVIGALAQRILEGGERPVFSYPTDYNGGGAVTAYLAAGVFALTGPGPHALKLIPLLWGLGALVLAYAFLRPAFVPPVPLVACLFYGTAVTLTRWNIDANGAPVIAQAFAIGIYSLVVAVDRDRSSLVRCALLGLTCGAGYYLNPKLVVLAAVSIAFVLGLARSRLRALAAWSAGAVVGTMPIWLVARRAILIRETSAAWPAAPLSLLRDVPSFFTADNLYGVPPARLMPNLVESAVIAGGLVLLALAVWRARRKAPGEAGALLPPARMAVLVMSSHLVAFAAAYAVNPLAGRNSRYLLGLEPALSLLAGTGLGLAVARRGAGRALALAVLAIGAANRTAEIARVLQATRVEGPSGVSDPAAAHAIIRLLRDHGYALALTGHWDLRWRIELLSAGSVKTGHLSRAWLAALTSPTFARAQGRYALVLEADEHRVIVRRLLAESGLRASEVRRLAGFDVYLVDATASGP